MSEVVANQRATFRDVLAIREFRALYIAQLLSVTGDQLARLAVAVLVFAKTGSTLLTGVSYAASYLPWVIGGPLLSGYADRKPRRNVMVTSDIARAVLVAIMAVPGLPPVTLIVIATLVALASPPFASARSSTIPDIVGEGANYVAASTLGNTTDQLSVVVGFAVGGGLVGAIGAHATLLLDAVTFAASALVAGRFMSPRPAAIVEPSHWLEELREGGRIVFHDRNLRWLVLMTWLVLGAIVSTEAAGVPYAHAHGHGSGTAGLLIACLPLGIVFGALWLGRFTHPSTAERLMMPLSLLTPALLALTAFDPRPQLVGVLWFVCGITSAATVTANRVFVATVPRAARGRAFGIAVAGIVGAQGIFSILTGLVSDYAGPAHAVADLALPVFAALVVLALGSAAFRPHQGRPITDVSHDQDEERQMTVSARTAQARAWALNLGLTVLAAASIPLLHADHAHVSLGLHAWWVFLVFVVGQAYPLQFEIRHQTFHVVLETVPLVIGLVFLPPLELVLLRTGSMLLVKLVIHAQPPVKWFFNTVTCAICTVAAVEAFRGAVPAGSGLHPSSWPAMFAAVVASEVVAGILVAAVMSMTGARAELTRVVRTISLGAAVSVIMTFLAIFTAAAIDYDTSTAWAISVFVVLALAGSQTYHRVAERAAALDRLYVVARELGPLATEPSDLAPALAQLREITRAARLELAVDDSSSDEFVTVVSVAVAPDGRDHTTVDQQPMKVAGPEMSRRRAELVSRLVPTGRSRSRRGLEERVSSRVHTADREIGVLTAVRTAGSTSFERSDVRLLDAAAGQLAAALEKGRLIDSLRKAATLDTLTGLANLDSLRTFLDTSLEGSAGGVLALVNLDRFHEVNDMLGHDAGDAVLAEVARRLESSPTQGSLVARVGGDQFAIAIPGAAGSEVARLAAMAVKSRVDGSIRLSEVSADVRVTIGIARAPDHGSDAATLLRRAEMAMAAAKGGTSGIGEWEPEYERDGSRRLHLLTGLRAALSDGSLRVEYQPKLRLGNGDVTGFEALVRWTHPELGPISPAEFVPIAEATGLISALTSTVLRQALTTCRAWHDAGKPVGIAVNVSARSLDDSVLVGQVAAMLTASGLEPRWLTLEITESSVMEDHARSLEVLRDLRMLGVRLSIDDFGTGYSSLHQLRGLPVHEVKIDRSFVISVDSDEADRAVIRAVVELCESLGLATVAEGVEKASQAFALESLGVRQVQGYFHGRPMPAAEAMEWLASRRVMSLAAY